MASTSQFYLIIAVAAILLVIVALTGWLLLRRIRARRDQLLSELRETPELRKDRAFNRIRMATAEAKVLADSGVDVSPAQELLSRAQTAYDSLDYRSASVLADNAHESLVRTRRSGPRALSSSSSTGFVKASRPTTGSTSPPRPSAATAWDQLLVAENEAAGGPAPAPSSSGLERNRAQAHFEISYLEDEVAKTRASGQKTPGLQEGGDLLAQAQAAYDRSQYSDALRLALRGRRMLGGQVGALPPSTAAPRTESIPATDEDLAQTAEEVAESDRCPNCGFPVRATDRYCRGCGAPRRGVANCPKCGQPAKPGDTFCGSCGAPLAG